jgi:hypothetical protein
MITYTWSISKLDCAPAENGLTNIVKVIHWGLVGVDESGVSASMSNSYPLPSPSPEAFTDYSTLTQETVISWLESNLDVGYIKSRLSNQIASQYNPPITSLPLPWIRVEEPVVEEETTTTTEESTTTTEETTTTTEETTTTEQTLEEKIADGYNPDARDGDEDGIVQEGTKWERPVGTEI